MTTARLSAVLTAIALLGSPALGAEKSCRPDEAGRIPAANPCLRLTGRALVAGPKDGIGAPGALVFDRPGIVLEVRFTGTSFALELAAENAHVELCVDGKCARERLAGPMREVRVAEGLPSGEHLFLLRKRSETIGSQVEAGRIRIDPGALLLEARKPAARRIEIIGDSYTVGYGVESPGRGGPGTQDESGRDCDDEKLRATTNTFAAQGWIAAELLGADAQTNAISGLGLVRAYGGDTTWLPYPEYYGRVLQNRAEPAYDPARPPFGAPWKPQAVVVALGTNDFSTELAPHEAKRFADRAALRAAWKKAYAEFLARLRRLYPGARFVLVSTNLATGNELADGVRDIVADEAKAGRKDLVAVDLPSMTQWGCHWHPDLATQRANGRRLAETISKLMGWPLAD